MTTINCRTSTIPQIRCYRSRQRWWTPSLTVVRRTITQSWAWYRDNSKSAVRWYSNSRSRYSRHDHNSTSLALAASRVSRQVKLISEAVWAFSHRERARPSRRWRTSTVTARSHKLARVQARRWRSCSNKFVHCRTRVSSPTIRSTRRRAPAPPQQQWRMTIEFIEVIVIMNLSQDRRMSLMHRSNHRWSDQRRSTANEDSSIV